MNFNVKATNLSLSDRISDYLDKKLEALHKFISDENSVTGGVELARSQHQAKGDVFRAEITIEAPHKFYRAEAEGETVYSAIDAAQEEILKELRRNKRKRLHLLRRGGNRLKEFTRDLSARGIGVKDFFERFRRRR